MSKVIDINVKRTENAIAHGRVPLSTTHVKTIDDVSLAERIVRIKQSLETINNLMTELKSGSSNNK